MLVGFALHVWIGVIALALAVVVVGDFERRRLGSIPMPCVGLQMSTKSSLIITLFRPGNAVIRTAKDAQNLQKSERTVILSAGQRAVLENSKGKVAIIKVISAETEDYYSQVNDLVFEYEILPD